MNKSWFKICILTSNLCCSSSSIKLDVNIKVKIGMMPEAISCTDGLIQSIARLGKVIFSIFVNFGPYAEVLVNCFQHLGYYSLMDQFLHWYLHLNHVKGDKYTYIYLYVRFVNIPTTRAKVQFPTDRLSVPSDLLKCPAKPPAAAKRVQISKGLVSHLPAPSGCLKKA